MLMYLPDYLKGWNMFFRVGPEFVVVHKDFENLNKNSIKRILEQEIKAIENDEDCPKYLKEQVSAEQVSSLLTDGIVSSTQSIKEIRDIYIENGRIMG